MTASPELALLLDRLTAERYRPVPPPPSPPERAHRPATLPPRGPADAPVEAAGGENGG